MRQSGKNSWLGLPAMWYKLGVKFRLAITILLAGSLVPLTIYGAAGSHSAARAPMRGAPARMVPPQFRGRPSRPVPAPRFVSPSRRVAGGTGTGYDPSTACLNNPNYQGSFYCSSLFGSTLGNGHRRPPIYSGGTYIPYYFGTPYEPEPEEAPEAQPTEPEPNNALAEQVQALTEEVEGLREEQESAFAPRMRRPPAQTQARPEKQPPTSFVYRNGREFEAENFAILGNTLWVFSEHSTRKIPLSELDMSATEKKNEDRGVDFVPPNGQ